MIQVKMMQDEGEESVQGRVSRESAFGSIQKLYYVKLLYWIVCAISKSYRDVSLIFKISIQHPHLLWLTNKNKNEIFWL